MANYRQQAQQEYDVSYNQKVQALKNQLAQNQQTLDQQKGGINSNFDTQVGNQNLASKKARNNISNTALGRGLANSSIVTSGLAEQDNINNRMVGAINTERTGALNNIEQQKALLAQGLQGSLATMSADREDAISSLARQFEDRDFEKSYKNKQLEQAREQYLADISYKNSSLAQQRELANAQLAFEREKYNSSLGTQKVDNSGYNAYLQAYSEIKGSDKSAKVKEQQLRQLAEEMQLYGSKNNVDLSDLIGKSNNYLSGLESITNPRLSIQKFLSKK